MFYVKLNLHRALSLRISKYVYETWNGREITIFLHPFLAATPKKAVTYVNFNKSQFSARRALSGKISQILFKSCLALLFVEY